QHPSYACYTHVHARLVATAVVVARFGAVGAPAVPLRHSAARCGAENDHAHCTKGPGLSPGPSPAVPAWFRRCRRTRRLPSPARRPRIRAWSTSCCVLQKRYESIPRNRLRRKEKQALCHAVQIGKSFLRRLLGRPPRRKPRLPGEPFHPIVGVITH